MKKLFLGLVFLFIMVLNSFSQSYIGRTDSYIKKDVINLYGSNVSNIEDENDILTISFEDGHTAIYFINTFDLCEYYALCYPIDRYAYVYDLLNGKFAKIENQSKWFYKDGDTYIYYKLFIDKEGTVCWVFVYPDFFENDINSLVKNL